MEKIMLNNIEQKRMDRLIHAMDRLTRFIGNDEEVSRYMKSLGEYEPSWTIEYIKETFESIEYNYNYKDLKDMEKMADYFMPIIKDEAFEIMKKDYNKGWIQITDENCEEITEQLNKEISQEIEADRLTQQFLKDIKK